MITAKRLRDLLDYDPLTGHFIWRVNKGRSQPEDRAGYQKPNGYVYIKVDQQDYVAHRLAWLWTTGAWPSEIDHINRNRADNRIDNLRECTRSQNFANRGPKVGRQLPKGVRLDPRGRRFTARIVVKGREISLGGFSTLEEASAAYMAAAHKYYGEFASNTFDGSRVYAGRNR